MSPPPCENDLIPRLLPISIILATAQEVTKTMDWITGTIEAIGVVIFCIWLVVPIREFAEIYRRLKR